MKRKFKIYSACQILAITFSAVILCFWAILNRYPLTFNHDSAAYIQSAIDKEVRHDRPILYGLFMLYGSFEYSLWMIVVIQALVVSLIIYYYFLYFSPRQNFHSYYITFIIIISIFMSASFDSSRLMADIFTPIAILCFGLLLFVNNIKNRDFVTISIILIISMAMHNTNIFVCLGLSLLFLISFISKEVRKKYAIAGIKLKRIIFVISLIIGSNLFLSSIHYIYGGGFKTSRGGTVFLFANLVEMGIIDTYLAENCEEKHYALCQFKDSLPNNFLWEPDSPLYKNGGWDHDAEYSAIVIDILTTPKYLIDFIYKSILLTFKQFWNFDLGEAPKPSEKIHNTIHTYFPNEYVSFSNSKQNRETLNFNFVNFMQTTIIAVCILFITCAFYFNTMTIRYRLLIIFILCGLLINAWLCGTFSGVFIRYQARIIWLLPLPIFLYGMEVSQSIILRIKGFKNQV